MSSVLATAFGSIKALAAHSAAHPLTGSAAANANMQQDKDGDVVVPATFSNKRRLSSSFPATVYQPSSARVMELPHTVGHMDLMPGQFAGHTASRVAPTALALQALSRFRSESVSSNDGEEVSHADKRRPSITVKGLADYNKPEYLFSYV